MGFLPSLDSKGFIIKKNPPTGIPFSKRTAKQKRRIYKKHKRKKFRGDKALGAKDYHVYMGSKRWRKRRRRYYATNPNRCFMCGSKEEVTLHHLNYERLGIEKDSDLMPLCWEHHEELHNVIGGSKRNMEKETWLFIANYKHDEMVLEVFKNL